MDQEDMMDFKALRAKFQDEELLLKQPKLKPALPEKPKVVPPPQSPTHYLPAGARPSLLTSINQSLEAKTLLAPRVVFKDDKESKKPLFQNNSKKPKSDGKLKIGKDKTKAGKEKLEEDSSEPKQKKLPLLPLMHKQSTAELVPATAPPKSTTQKKKSILGFRRSSKTNPAEVPPDPILDSPSFDFAGAAPLIPVPSAFDDTLPDPETSAPKDLSASLEIPPPFTIPASPDFFPPPAFIPDYPTPESETPVEIETPALSISRPASQTETTPAVSVKTTTPSPSPSPPVPEVLAETVTEAVNIAAVEAPPPPSTAAPKASLLSALERAEDMNPGKRPSADQRIMDALDKARKKPTSPNHTSMYSITPPPDEFPRSESPTLSQPFIPPIDYEGNAHPPKLGQLNGIDHRQASPVLNSITEEGSDLVPEMLVVPPPPPKKVLPDPKSLGPAPEKPDRPPFVNLSDFIPPPVEHNAEIPAVHVALSETDTTEFDDVGSTTHSTELPGSEWANGHYTGPDSVDGQFYSNGTTGDDYQMNLQPLAGLEGAEASNGVFVSAESAYEDVSATKKKGKADSGKKRKGPPKNPYAEAATPTNEEKSKTGRFGKSEKKVVVAEGPDEKELKKREKQRLEKEKKELKEKQEREKKEQKEREKKENEMKKKFKITGQEDAMYQATVTVTTKGRKNDLPVSSGDAISIIRTTNCPKGKWLARDNSNNYGYVAVDHVELDIKEMLELGKKAATTRQNSSIVVGEGEVTSTGSRASNHFPISTESFTDDSEEWTGDDEENLSPAADTADPYSSVIHSRTLSMPDMGNKDLSINHQHSHSDLSADNSQPQTRHEALHKLATFFHSPKHVAPSASDSDVETSPVHVKEEETAHLPGISETQSMDFDNPNMIILPPPDLYADFGAE